MKRLFGHSKETFGMRGTRALALLLAVAGMTVQAQDAPSAPEAVEAARALEAAEAHRAAAEAEAAAAYEEALRAAEAEQRQALEAVEAARQELEREAERRRQAAEELRRDEEMQAREREEARRAQEAVRRELQKAHENLRRASREVARVHREMTRPRAALAPSTRFAFSTGNRAVISVILGAQDDDGVEILGVSPDGPAERAGVMPGDRIVEIMQKTLGDADASPRAVLQEALSGIEAGDEITMTLQRDDERRSVTVVAEEREPFTWHSYTRLPSVPGAESREIIVERIELPQIDETALQEEMERLQEELEQTRIFIHREGDAPAADLEETWSFEFYEDLSELGDAMLAGTGMWTGMPLTRGLKLAEVTPGLGAYFGADRGALVLEAREGNALNLRSGDVILRVNGEPVSNPADVMRSLRTLESGDEVELDIRRQQQDETLRSSVPENRVGWSIAPPAPLIRGEIGMSIVIAPQASEPVRH